MKKFVQSSLLLSVPNITHAFGTEAEPLPSLIESTWSKRRPKWKQNHGVSIAQVETPEQECGEVDALTTSTSGLPIGVVTADCVPILISHRSGKQIASVHAGWRGTHKRILKHLWKHLAAQGNQPYDYVACVGPSIGPCCYQVSEELAQEFITEFKDWDASLSVPRPRYLDLPAINAAELKLIGFKEVEILRLCTHCNKNPSFFSYRRNSSHTELSKMRQYSVIQIQT